MNEAEPASDTVERFAAAERQVSVAQRAAAPAEDAATGHSRFRREAKWTPEQQWEFNRAVTAALRQMLEACRKATADTETRLAGVVKDVSAAVLAAERIHELQTRLQELDARLEKTGMLDRDVHALRNEISERIQHVLDEQRVCIRQLSLQASEDAVLSDRARRATELRLEELMQRVERLAPSAAA